MQSHLVIKFGWVSCWHLLRAHYQWNPSCSAIKATSQKVGLDMGVSSQHDWQHRPVQCTVQHSAVKFSFAVQYCHCSTFWWINVLFSAVRCSTVVWNAVQCNCRLNLYYKIVSYKLSSWRNFVIVTKRLTDWQQLSWHGAIVLTVCNSIDSLQLSWQSAIVLTVCNYLDSLQLSWQSAIVLTVCNGLNRLWFVPLLDIYWLWLTWVELPSH